MHDWTFLGFEFSWRTGDLTLNVVDDRSQKLGVLCVGVTGIQVSRDFEWGESVSINKFSEEENEGVNTLRIEMQSGDQITIQGRLFVSLTEKAEEE